MPVIKPLIKDGSQQLSVNLEAGSNIFTSSISNIHDVNVVDTSGNQIGLSVNISGSTIDICSLVAINNVLINIQGE